MSLGIGTRLVCFFFCFFNFVIWLLGSLVLGVGIYVRIEAGPWRDLVDLDLTQPANLLIAAGVFVMVMGFLGCCGACKKVKCCLMIYSILVFLVVMLEVTAGAYAYKKREQVVKKLVGAIEDGIRNHYARSDQASMSTTIVLDMFQQRVGCCGAMGPQDFHNSYWQNATGHNESVPDSCCRKRVKGCSVNVTLNDSMRIYTYGCVEVGTNWVRRNIEILRNVGVGVGLVELVGIMSAVCLWWNFKHEKKGRRK